MAIPELRYTYADGRKASEFVPYEAGEAIIDARLVQYPDGSQAWLDRHGLKLEQMPPTNGQEAIEQGSQGDEGVQGGNTEKRQARARQRSKSQKPQAGDSHCAI